MIDYQSTHDLITHKTKGYKIVFWFLFATLILQIFIGIIFLTINLKIFSLIGLILLLGWIVILLKDQKIQLLEMLLVVFSPFTIFFGLSIQVLDSFIQPSAGIVLAIVHGAFFGYVIHQFWHRKKRSIIFTSLASVAYTTSYAYEIIIRKITETINTLKSFDNTNELFGEQILDIFSPELVSTHILFGLFIISVAIMNREIKKDIFYLIIPIIVYLFVCFISWFLAGRILDPMPVM